MPKRSKEELIMLCKPVLGRPDIITLVENSSSPTAAYQMVMSVGEDKATACAARWLGVLRRDHPEAYVETIQQAPRHATAARHGKGNHEGSVCG